jgi:hypothetical protein
MAGLGGAAVWAARGWRGGTGFAALLGLAVPSVSIAVIFTAIAPELTDLPGLIRTLLELISAVWLAAALTAAALGLAGLVRRRQLARHKPSRLTALTAVAGVGYSLANILAQGDNQGEPAYNALGPNVQGWWIVWGIVFLVLVIVPPLLTAFLLAAPGVRLAAWSGWLAFGLVEQVGDSPARGITAAPGLYLTWILWILVLAGTLVMASRRRGEAAAERAAQD